ncbi:MAG: hypothetical protein DI531_04890 [Brevundimonas sp.]|jgi:uncharacterized membrane protein YecN with MAPEG domain|uniref:MAPEG family protein n=1 Tax=Brevundimonas sp. TaxID=1871086 RepID=UPI000DB02D73|nr:MAPEG family protein [Brevundimonas sp.]PZU75380.1 MAG: hypothetical protein DI531_04890 [Brevundimonas sp.]
MFTALVCTAILGLLLFGLGLLISIRRFVTKDFYIGAVGPTSFTTKLSRAHGNTAEFAPFLALLFLALPLISAPPAWAAAAMIGATVSRGLVVIGFLTSATLEHMSLAKAAGAIGTYGFGLALTAALFIR